MELEVGKGRGGLPATVKERLIQGFVTKDANQMEDAVEILSVFIRALQKFNERNTMRGGLWKRSGWRMNLVFVKSKATRLWSMFGEGRGEPDLTLDDAVDLLNYVAFFIITYEQGDEHGTV